MENDNTPMPEDSAEEVTDLDVLHAQLEAMEAERERLDVEAELQPDHEPQPEEVAQPPEPPAPQRDPVLEWAVRDVAQQVGQRFAARHPDAGEYGREMKAFIERSRVLERIGSDPVRDELDLESTVEDAYRRAKVARLAERAELDKLRIHASKLRASSSGAGSTLPAPRPVRRLEDLSLSELESKLRAFSRNR